MAFLLRQASYYCKGLSTKILNILFDAFPGAIQLQDKSGLLPIHYACLNKMSPLNALILLVKLYPESIAV
jgi:hypothetical protein